MNSRAQRLGNTVLLRENHCWCASCKQRVSNLKGRYVVQPGGLRQKWICNECLTKARAKENKDEHTS